MKKKGYLIIMMMLTFIVIPAFLMANIFAINFKSMPEYEKLNSKFKKLFDGLYLYKNWTPVWKFNINKDDTITFLKGLYDDLGVLSLKHPENIELELLRGDISHFLYNLDQKDFFEKAVFHYKHCMKMNKEDYRPYWFIGNHLHLSAKLKESIENFRLIATNIPSEDLHPFFWEDYAQAANTSVMTSTSIMAMDNAKKILKKPCRFDEELGKMIRSRLLTPDRKKEMQWNEVWYIIPEDNIIISRSMGINIKFEKDWKVQPGQYKNNSSFMVLKLTPEKGKNNRDIIPNIALFCHLQENGETLDDFIGKIVPRNLSKKRIESKSGIENSIAYEFRNPNMYPDQGGARYIVVAFERNQPAYPGVKIEHPILPQKSSGKLQYYRIKNMNTRFDGKIYYVMFLDVCESVFENSNEKFKKFVSSQIKYD